MVVYTCEKNHGFIVVLSHCRVDPDSQLSNDMIQLKEREGKDHILLNFTFKVLHHPP